MAGELAYCERLCLKISRDEIDSFEVISEGRKFGFLDFTEAETFSQKKHVLLRAVLEEILKVKDTDTRKYEEMLETTNKFLELGALKQASAKGYRCTFIGCLFRGRIHRQFLNHLKTVHRTAESFLCSFQHKCRRHFEKVDELLDHVKIDHALAQPPSSDNNRTLTSGVDVISNSCRCNMVSCGQKVFNSFKKLASHVINDHVKEPRFCIFSNCDQTFNANAKSTLRNHFRTKHFDLNKDDLKSVHQMGSVQSDHLVLQNSGDTVEQDEVQDIEDEAEIDDDDVDDAVENKEEEQVDENHFMMAYADFINRLINFKFIPITTVKLIAAEYLQQAQQSAKSRETVLRESLSRIPNISQEMLEKIVEENQQDPFLKTQEELSSETKRLKFMEDNFKLVKPREIVLNPEAVKNGSQKEVIHYVPILEAFRILVEDDTFNAALENGRNEERSESIIEDIKDGAGYKNSQYFIDNPDAFALMIYSDGVELCNPLASGRGKHKIVQVFWQVCDLPRFHRSSVDRLQVGLIFKEKLLKKYSYAKIFQNLLHDLKVLESEGVQVLKPISRKIKASLLLYSGDNLECHQVGGFSASFGSKDVCRHCHIQYDDLPLHIHDYDGDSRHEPWSKADYDACAEDVTEVDEESLECHQGVAVEDLFNEFEEPIEDDDSSGSEDEDNAAANKPKYGVKKKCVFNELKEFHCVTSMPPDSLHDLMEGVIPQDLLGIIRILIEKSWFTLEQYNLALKNLKYSAQESSNKPQEVPSNSKVKKLPGKATSNWVHMRNFLVILYLKGWIEDKNEEAFQLAIKLHELTERLTAEAFRNHELETLEDVIIEYLDLRKVVNANHPVLGRPKPKHHFITHYPNAIKKFGPPSGFWTGRFESKHRVAKATAEASKNFINITKTVSQRQQDRMCSTYYLGMFSCEKFKLPTKVKTKNDLKSSGIEEQLRTFMHSSNDLVCSEIEFKNRKYKAGDVVVLVRVDISQMTVGLVKSFLVQEDRVMLIIRKYVAVQNIYRIFETKSFSSDLEIVSIEDLKDTYPLFKRGSEEQFIIVPHHHISFQYD